MKPIILIGVRQDNRAFIAAAESQGRTVAGFLDKFYVGQTIDQLPVIASELDLLDHKSKIYQDKDNYDWFVSTIFTGITNTRVENENNWLLRNSRAEIATQANLNLINIQHANSFVDPSCTLGKNIYIGWGSYFGGYCTIGNFNYFGYNCGLGHHVNIGDFCTLINTVSVGNVNIGKNVFLGPGTTISRRGKSNTTIEDNVIVAPGVTVVKSIPKNTVLLSQGKTLKNQHFVN